MSLASQRVHPLHFGVRTKRETASTETSLQMKILKMEKKRKNQTNRTRRGRLTARRRSVNTFFLRQALTLTTCDKMQG